MAGDRPGSISMSFGVGGDPDGEGEAERRSMRIVVVAPLVPGREWSTGRTPSLDPLAIDAASFDAVFGQLAPSLRIEVPDPFAPGDPPIEVDLVWRDRKSMRPSEIVTQVPALRALAHAARVVREVAARRISADDARAELARMLPRTSWADALVSEVRAATPAASPASGGSSGASGGAGAASAPGSAPAAGGGALDALLDMVDVSPGSGAHPPVVAAPTPAAAPTEISRIVAAVARSARPGAAPAPRAVVGTAPERLERAFQAILSSILQHPEVRRLERAWRGVRLLVEHCDRRAGVDVEVVCAGLEQVTGALSRLAEGDPSRAAVDLVVIDQVLGASAAELEALHAWASIAEGMLAPLLVGGRAEMVGGDSLGAVARSTSMLSASDDPRAVAFRALAAREASRWVAVVLNDPLLRAPYTSSTSRQTEPPYAETASDPGAEVFGHGAFVVAALCARSYARLGWPTAITGARDGAIGGLPVRTVTERGGDTAIPLETLPTEDAARELARAGLTVLCCAPNSDTVVVPRAPAIHRSAASSTGPTATLADQLFVGRIGRAIQQIASAIPAGTDPHAGAQVVQIALAELFDRAPPTGRPEIVAEIDPKRSVLTVTVRPRRFAGISIEEVKLGAALG